MEPPGTVVRTIPLPQAGANDSIAFANLRGKQWPQDIIVKTRYSQEWAMVGIDDTTTTPTTKAGTVLWNHKMLASNTGMSDLGTGHYPLAYDWNGDGKDEVMCGYDFLNSDGSCNGPLTPRRTRRSPCMQTPSPQPTSTPIRQTDTR